MMMARTILLGMTTIIFTGCITQAYEPMNMEKHMKDNFVQICTGTHKSNMTCRWIPNNEQLIHQDNLP